MRSYSFRDVTYYVKNEIEAIMEKYTDYVEDFARELERDKSIVNCEKTENYMLEKKGR